MNKITNNNSNSSIENLSDFARIKEALVFDERNSEYTKRGIMPIYQVDTATQILIIGQAPGAKVEENGIPFMDKSGENLRDWMGVDEATFYSKKIAIMPMDFYFPGKGKTGDLPPRKFIAEEYHEKLLALMPNVKLIIFDRRIRNQILFKGHKKGKFNRNSEMFSGISTKIFSNCASKPFEFSLAGKESLVFGKCGSSFKRKD